MVERRLFLQIQSINIIQHNANNLIVVPVTKRMEIIMCIHVCLISQMSFDCKTNGGKKAFLANPKHQYPVSQYGDNDCHGNNKKN